MNDEPDHRAPDPDSEDPVERRLAALLGELRGAPEPDDELVAQVMRAARWQRAVRGAILAVGELAATIVDALELRARHRAEGGPE